jgi:hypothetical protein
MPENLPTTPMTLRAGSDLRRRVRLIAAEYDLTQNDALAALVSLGLNTLYNLESAVGERPVAEVMARGTYTAAQAVKSAVIKSMREVGVTYDD